jgi:hypothetical protein
MGTWKFLVQREGKQSWTALEGDVMSLEPGRYRIAARAPVANTPIAIEIAVMQPDGERRHYRRSTRTNDDGLLAVIPFTDLSDGNWTLNCQTMGNAGAAEAASMSWQVIEPTRIEVADPWAEDGENARPTDCLDEAVAADTADTIEPHDDSNDPDNPVVPVQAEAHESAQLADRSLNGEAIESSLTLDETDMEELSELTQEDATTEGEATEVEGMGDASEGSVAVICDPDSGAINDPSDDPSDDPSAAAPEPNAINPIAGKSEAQAIAVLDAEVDLQNAADEVQDSINSVINSIVDSVSTDSVTDAINEPTYHPSKSEDDAIDEPQHTNVIAMPGMATRFPAAWMDSAGSGMEEGEAEMLEGADISEGAESASALEGEGTGDTTDRTLSSQGLEGESFEADAPILGVDSEILNLENPASSANAANPPIEDEPLPDATVPDIVADPEPPTLTTYTPGQLKLQLDRTSFTVAAGGTLILSGCIHADPSIDPRSRLAGLHLRLRLREPQSSRVLTVRQFLLRPTSGHTLHFERSVPLPERTTSKLILGELLLCDAVPNTLDQQSFTVTAGLESLLNNLTDRNRASESVVWQKDQWSDARAQADLPPKTTTPLIPLPPKPTLDLPGFVTSPVSGIDKSQLLASLGLAPATPPSDDPALESSASDLDADLDSSLNAAIGDNTASRDAEAAAALEASRRAATQSNRFPLEPLTPPSHRNDRFVSRLNQIAHDNELTSWLNEGDLDLGAEGLPEDFATGDLAPLTGAREVLSPGAIERDREMSQEIVLDRPAEQPHRPSFSRSSPHTSVTRPVLPADISIPSPELIVPPGHLTAGRSILVRARMPELSARIYIKLWIYDRQNQALLDGPRWLTDFLPIGDGMLEGMVNLTVPYGGLDVQFEAIAVEVETDRESYKTAIDRRIVPSAPPTLPLENSPLRH